MTVIIRVELAEVGSHPKYLAECYEMPKLDAIVTDGAPGFVVRVDPAHCIDAKHLRQVLLRNIEMCLDTMIVHTFHADEEGR